MIARAWNSETVGETAWVCQRRSFLFHSSWLRPFCRLLTLFLPLLVLSLLDRQDRELKAECKTLAAAAAAIAIQRSEFLVEPQ